MYASSDAVGDDPEGVSVRMPASPSLTTALPLFGRDTAQLLTAERSV